MNEYAVSSSNTILERYDGNPILTPNEENWWESKSVFNCASLYDGEKVHLLYRAVGEYKDYISRIGYASSIDGLHLQEIMVWLPNQSRNMKDMA
jgi:beta-1,2-mannobiose phosphorylase / 1,2-beta-oligomannan phosphorylase